MSYQMSVTADAYATDAGPVVKRSIINLPECTINQTEPAARVRFMVALLGDSWCLFYERGGDWASFGDGEQHEAEHLEDWMPDGIRECVKAVIGRIGDAADEDMDWFIDWADSAEETLNAKETE